MSQKLAIFSKHLGAPSETFIKRHIEGLAPDRTVVVAKTLEANGKNPLLYKYPLYQRGEASDYLKKLPNFIHKKLPARVQNSADLVGISKFLSAQNVTVILAQYLNDSWPYLRLAQKCGVRFFAHAHGYDLSRIFKDKLWRDRYADYAKADGVIVVNRVMRERLLSVGVPEHKIYIIPYGVDVSASPLTHPEEDVVRCLAVGRMVGKKAPLKLLEAFRLAVESNPRLHLDYVGTGPLAQAGIDYVERFNLQDCVTFHGLRSNEYVLQLMKNANLFLQHSIVDPETGDEEGVPVAILEAMSMALPVISTFHTGIPEAVLHETTGLLAQEGDAQGMANDIIQLGTDPTLRADMGIKAWMRARDNFSWENEKTALLKVYGCLIRMNCTHLNMFPSVGAKPTDNAYSSSVILRHNTRCNEVQESKHRTLLGDNSTILYDWGISAAISVE